MSTRVMWDQCRWVPWAIVACFGVVIAVNSLLAYFALHSDTGLVTKHPFELGNGYNRVLDQGETQDRLGWHGTAGFGGQNLQGEIDVQLVDAAGVALDGLTVRAHITRPLGPQPDQTVSMSGSGGGHYAAALTLPKAGLWDIHVRAAKDGESYQFTQRINVP